VAFYKIVSTVLQGYGAQLSTTGGVAGH